MYVRACMQACLATGYEFGLCNASAVMLPLQGRMRDGWKGGRKERANGVPGDCVVERAAACVNDWPNEQSAV